MVPRRRLGMHVAVTRNVRSYTTACQGLPPIAHRLDNRPCRTSLLIAATLLRLRLHCHNTPTSAGLLQQQDRALHLA